MLDKHRRNKRNKYQHGGEVKIDFPMPEVQHGTTQDALKSNVDDTKKANEEQTALNKSGGGDDIVVPQLGAAAGDAGNDQIAAQIGVLNQGKADTEFDKDAPVVPKAKQGGSLTPEQIKKLKEKLRKQVVTTPGKFSLAKTGSFKDVGGIVRERDYTVPEMVVGGKRRRRTRKKTHRTRKKNGGHCQKQLKKVKILLKTTKKNKTKKNIKKLKKHMKILTKKIKDYNNPRKRLKKNKSHIKRYRKIKSQYKRLI